MPRSSTDTAALLAGLLVAATGVDADERGIISACADGDLTMCEQLELSGGDAVTGNTALDQRARAFAARSDTLGLAEAPAPDLAGAYPLIVADYFQAPTIDEQERRRWYREAILPECAAHYADTWLVRRNWWPVDSDGKVLWHLVYYHVTDHYFGYCLARVPAPGQGVAPPQRTAPAAP